MIHRGSCKVYCISLCACIDLSIFPLRAYFHFPSSCAWGSSSSPPSLSQHIIFFICPTAILNFVVHHRDLCEFVMEVTDKTRADVKVCGSVIYIYVCVYVYIYMCVYLYINMCLYICLYFVRIYIYIYMFSRV